jgi:DNA helicase HerA-like ATPase
VARLLDEDDPLEDLAPALERGTLHGGTLGAIQRKLGMFRRFGFLQDNVSDDPVRQILDYIDQGTSVILEFGRYGNSLEAYLLVANYITRRIHRNYVKRKEAALGRQADEPRQLVITIEEAHKFLDPGIASQTIFGTIARELRKYNVTLLIVDQRPSGIDPEVMSQIGTRVTCLLDDEADVRAVLSGISGAGQLRQVLARLDTRQQALIMGHAVPMPVVVKTRAYDTDFYAAMGYREVEDPAAVLARGRAVLRGDEDLEI